MPPARRPPRVLLVIDRMEEIGGSEASTALILTGLQGHGIHFDVVALDGISLSRRAELESLGTNFFEPSASTFAAQLKCVMRALRITKPDLIHATLARSELVARVAALICGVPVIASIVSMQYSPEALAVATSTRKLEVYRRLDGLLARHATFAFHAVSEASADAACAALGIEREQITVVNRGRDRAVLGVRDTARRAAARAQLGLDDAQPLLLNVGRQDAQKGHVFLLDALVRVAAKHPRVVLVVAGREGPATTALQSKIDELGLRERVQLLGARSDVPELLCGADLFVQSSLWEGLPGAALEALALEVPIVAFDIAPAREALDGVAILVPTRDVGALAACIDDLLSHPDRRAELAALGLERFDRRYTKERYLENMLRFYESTVERTRTKYRPAWWARPRRDGRNAPA